MGTIQRKIEELDQAIKFPHYHIRLEHVHYPNFVDIDQSMDITTDNPYVAKTYIVPAFIDNTGVAQELKDSAALWPDKLDEVLANGILVSYFGVPDKLAFLEAIEAKGRDFWLKHPELGREVDGNR